MEYYHGAKESFIGIRVIPYGWAKKEDFEFLEANETYIGERFQSDNKYVHRKDLATIDKNMCNLVTDYS